MAAESLLAGPTMWVGTTRRRRVQANAHGQEAQHFLLTAGACTLSELEVGRMSDDEAYAAFEAIRFADRGGVPYCPYCDTSDAYRMTIQRKTKRGPVPTTIYKCHACRRQFSVTTGTIFASRKMPIRDILYSAMVFTIAVSGEAALRLRRACKRSYKTVLVAEGKFREAIQASRSTRRLSGTVEVDGTDIGGHARKAREKKNGRETRSGPESPKHAIVALRERRPGGESRTAIFQHEARYRDPVKGTDFIRDNVEPDTAMISDEGFTLGYIGPHQTVKHKLGYKQDGVHTNGVEGLFARVKRAENGVHYHWSGKYLDLYAAEISWREDYRRVPNGDQWKMLVSAITKAPVSRRWAGYWQRSQATGAPRRKRNAGP